MVENAVKKEAQPRLATNVNAHAPSWVDGTSCEKMAEESRVHRLNIVPRAMQGRADFLGTAGARVRP